MAKIYLGLGSNVGNRARNIYSALRRLQDKIQLDPISSLYETQPVGYSHQAWFLNLVCAGETHLSPEDLLVLAKRIEREMGRDKGIRCGPRIVDIDILFYEDLIMDTPQLEIPHPRLAERGFVLIPLNEIAPGLLHPRLKLSVRDLLDTAESPHEVRLYTLRDWRASD
jgi:2-amino-4-hydroxy-6-hydroxymethyldihydropteridine diphosphokinase